MSDRQDMIPYGFSDCDDLASVFDIYEEHRPITITQDKRTRPVFETCFELGTGGIKIGIRFGKETETHTRYEFFK